MQTAGIEKVLKPDKKVKPSKWLVVKNTLGAMLLVHRDNPNRTAEIVK